MNSHQAFRLFICCSQNVFLDEPLIELTTRLLIDEARHLFSESCTVALRDGKKEVRRWQGHISPKWFQTVGITWGVCPRHEQRTRIRTRATCGCVSRIEESHVCDVVASSYKVTHRCMGWLFSNRLTLRQITRQEIILKKQSSHKDGEASAAWC